MLRQYTVKGTLEIKFELNVLAESEQDAEDLAMELTDDDLIEGAVETSMYFTGVSRP